LGVGGRKRKTKERKRESPWIVFHGTLGLNDES
jgi:hypothetical protein